MSDASSPAPMMRSCKVSQSSHFARPGRGESSSRDGALSPASVRSKPAWSTHEMKNDVVKLFLGIRAQIVIDGSGGESLIMIREMLI